MLERERVLLKYKIIHIDTIVSTQILDWDIFLLKYIDKIKITVIVIIEQTKQVKQRLGEKYAGQWRHATARNLQIKGGVSYGWF